MFPRMAILATLIPSLLLLPGCPGAENAVVGAWTISFGGLDFGLQLNANGEAISFMIGDVLPGIFTWEADGTRVLFHHVYESNSIIWAARLNSESTMSGAWVGWDGQGVGVSDTWTAVKQ